MTHISISIIGTGSMGQAFNATLSGALSSGGVGSAPTTVLIASDDEEATALLAGVVTSGGFGVLA